MTNVDADTVRTSVELESTRKIDLHEIDVVTAADEGVGLHARLNVELRAVGLVATMAISSWALAAAWTWLAVGDRALEIRELALAVLVSLLLALACAIAMLPRQRWPRASNTPPPTTLWLLLAGAPALLTAGWLIWRDRQARKQLPPSSAAESCFRRLLAMPPILATGFAVSIGTAQCVALWSLTRDGHASSTTAVTLAMTMLAGTALHAVILAERLRAMFRPEVLAVALRRSGGHEPATGLAPRLWKPALIAGLALVATPLLLGRVWTERHARHDALIDAQTSAVALTDLAERAQLHDLGSALALAPGSTVTIADRHYGRPDPIPPREGAIDLDADERPDVWVIHHDHVSTRVPIETPTLPSSWPHALLVLIAASVVAGTTFLLAHDVAHDVTRTANQVAAVASGAIPPPLREDSFSTAELRQLVTCVDRLVERITDANMEKFISIEKANEADRLKSQFLANMSHDLRSPLNSILGFSELMLAGIDGDLTDEQREVVTMMHQSGRGLLQQIDDILDAAKLDARRMEFQAEAQPPVALLGRAIQNARTRLGRSIELQTRAEAGLPPAFVDPYRTTQALENVLVFASDKLDRETVELDLSIARHDAEQTIMIRVFTPRRPALAADLDRVLRGFHRVPGQEGLSLGLPIAAQILELQGGRLDIEDRHAGTAFCLHLPIARRRLRTMRLSEESGVQPVNDSE